MGIFRIEGVSVKGIAAGVPKSKLDNNVNPLLDDNERSLFINTTGIESVRRAEGMSLTELALPVAQALLVKLDWPVEEIGLLVFVTQTPDYPIPPSSIMMQQKLNMSKDTLAFDINLGCSGYVYGLSVVSAMMKNLNTDKALLCVGDISSVCISDKDKSTAPLFSDAVSVTALKKCENSKAKMTFNLQSDGSGYKAIIIEEGGSKSPLSVNSFVEKHFDGGVVRKGFDMALNGIEVFNFSLREVAANINALLDELNETTDPYDFFVFHQANKLMNESIRRKLKLPPEKVPYSLKDFGNTSSASIPLTLVTKLHERLEREKLHLVLSGFGVGLSWGSVSLEMDRIKCPELIIV